MREKNGSVFSFPSRRSLFVSSLSLFFLSPKKSQQLLKRTNAPGSLYAGTSTSAALLIAGIVHEDGDVELLTPKPGELRAEVLVIAQAATMLTLGSFWVQGPVETR